jgi:hypothetical protein
MAVTLVTRWTTPNVAASTSNTKRAKAFWIKHGALDLRLSQIFTGPSTGHYLIATMFADMAGYAKASAAGAADPELQQIIAQNAKDGAVMQEREILIGIDSLTGNPPIWGARDCGPAASRRQD